MSDGQRDNLQQAVINYIDHVEDRNYLLDIQSVFSIGHLNAAVVDLLRSPDQETVHFTTLFIRDSVMYLPDSSFSQAFFNSPLVPVLEDLVLTDNYWIRAHAVYTLGKTICRRSLPALHRAFDSIIDRDPLFLPHLVGEIFWLETEKSWGLLNRTVASPEYTVRWSTLGVLSPYGHAGATFDDEVYQTKLRCYKLLRHDNSPLVQVEADYCYRLLASEQSGRTLPKPARRRQRKMIELRRPSLTFDDVVRRFSNHLYQNDLTTYTVADLEHFIAINAQDEPSGRNNG